jgi:hypothetical protein
METLHDGFQLLLKMKRLPQKEKKGKRNSINQWAASVGKPR